MKWVNALRKELWCTQHEMSAYLGMNRSLLALAETSRRDLPTPFQIDALQLYVDIDTLKKNVEELPAYENLTNEEKAREQEILKQQQLRAGREIARLQQKLGEMVEAYEKAKTTLAMLPSLKIKVANRNAQLLPLLELCESKANDALTSNGLDGQIKLRARIAGLQAIMDMEVS
ncbi:hypothetical protein AB9P05_19740 [Roseivirga sp. BDSF3-8]|uniref:hypothetical protein n=1 Tax=Roseivirga sp. BDSF3-8 TaxID=3241598 RepID=UPI00353217CC